MSGAIDLEQVLCTAESIYTQLSKCETTPNVIQEILGLETTQVDTPSEPSDVKTPDSPPSESPVPKNSTDYHASALLEMNDLVTD